MRFKWLALALLVSTATFAQKKKFTLQDVISGGENYISFTPENVEQLMWQPKVDAYSQVIDDALVYTKVGLSKNKTLISLEKLNELCAFSVESFPSYKWYSQNEIRFLKGDSLLVVDVFKQSLSKNTLLPADRSHSDYLFLDEKVAYVKDDNLFVANLRDGSMEEIQITNDGGNGIVIAQSVHRNEFGIRKGTYWSAKGNKLAFYRMDESMVSDYPLVDYTTRVAEYTPNKYPMAGMKSHQVKVGIWNASTYKTVFIEKKRGEEEFYYTNLCFTPDEAYLSIAVVNRDQNHMRFNLYDATTGAFVRTVFEEEKSTYVEPEHAALFLEKNQDLFLWQSERSGHNHIYQYNLETGEHESLTSGNWDVKKVLGFDAKGATLFFESSITSPLETQLCKVDLKSKKIDQVSQVQGTHSTKLSASGKYFIDSWSNVDVPRKVDIVSVKGGKTVKNLVEAENPYKEYALGETELITLKAGDGVTDLHARLIKPTNFDANKKYPVVIYVYGGPHAQLVHNKWMAGARMWQHYMAQQGYVCFTLDNRGSGGRGQDFEDVIHRQLGQAEMDDQVEGVKYLQSLPFVDADRIGVHGWSYGGYMTISLMTNFPEYFKVGVSGGPVIDWKYYEIMYGERYMDSPEDNIDGYAKTSLLSKAKDLDGRLLIIHGAQDPTVVMQHSLAFVRACVEESTPVDYFVYPTHQHNVRGKDRVHLMQKVSQYFFDFLPAE